jgi:hypothetical protein
MKIDQMVYYVCWQVLMSEFGMFRKVTTSALHFANIIDMEDFRCLYIRLC